MKNFRLSAKSLSAITVWSLVCVLTSLSGASSHAQDAAESARALLERHKAALVIVTATGKLQAKTSGEAIPDQPQLRRTLGVTVDRSGMLVVSNYAIDPSADFVGRKAQHEGNVVDIVSAKMEFTKVEISYGDSTRIPGTVVLQRPEQDLAFIMPDEATAKRLEKDNFSFVDLGSFSPDVKPADEVIGLSRSKMAFEFTPTVLVGRVTGVFRGDRTFYLTTVGTAYGMPVFALDGSLVGLTLERLKDGKRTGLLGTLSAGSIGVQVKMAIDTYKAQ